MDLGALPLIARRGVEAQLMARVYAEAVPRLGEDAAMDVLNAAIDSAAREAGAAFAAKAPGGVPSLEHFAGVLTLWQTGGALSIADALLEDGVLSFRVTRCGYMEFYQELGIPAVLHATLSCRRDAAFAAGYAPQLVLDRPETISAGHAACLFRFRWQD